MNSLEKHKAELHLQKAFDYLHYSEAFLPDDMKERVLTMTLELQALMKELRRKASHEQSST